VIHPELYSFKDKFFLINVMDADISASDAFKLISIRPRKARFNGESLAEKREAHAALGGWPDEAAMASPPEGWTR
jgi:hypothetical protein